jgi:hypothetical protein
MSLAGLGAGGALAFGLLVLLEFASAPIYHEDDLRNLTSAPLLAGIPPIYTPAEERARTRQHVLEVTAALLLLTCAPLVTLLAYLKG